MEPEGIDNEFIQIGALNTGDAICFRKGFFKNSSMWENSQRI